MRTFWDDDGIVALVENFTLGIVLSMVWWRGTTTQATCLRVKWSKRS